MPAADTPRDIRNMTADELDEALANAWGDEYDAIEDEMRRREDERESRINARQHAAWKGAHNRRLSNGGY